MHLPKLAGWVRSGLANAFTPVLLFLRHLVIAASEVGLVNGLPPHFGKAEVLHLWLWEAEALLRVLGEGGPVSLRRRTAHADLVYPGAILIKRRYAS